MIDISKFDQDVLTRYQQSFLPENRKARWAAERMNPLRDTLRPAHKSNQTKVHIARFEQALHEDEGYENTVLTNIPWVITHNLKHCIIEPGGFWKIDRGMNWKGIKRKQVRDHINSSPEFIYGRMGAVSLLAGASLDPENEIARFYSDWSARYLLELDNVDILMASVKLSPKSRQQHLNMYGEALDKMSDELTAEVLKILRLLHTLHPVSDERYY